MSGVVKGTIVAFHGSWMSGLALLEVRKEDGTTDNVICENGPTVRALECCFGDVIGDGHNVKGTGGHIGKEIYYSIDALGVLQGFTPVIGASPRVVLAYLEGAGL